MIQVRAGNWRIILLCLGFLGLGLGCGEPDPPQPLHCSSASQCPSRYHCSPQGVCTADVLCQSDGDCCLAERCEAGLCRTRQACSESAQCLDPATECRFGICAPRPCDAATPCAAGLGCVAGVCVAKAPCGGSCPAGQACAPRIDRCVAAPSVACMPGQLAYFTNELELMPEGCAAVPPKLGCAALPPLAAGDRAPPGVLLTKGGELLHLAYDRTYGDAVLARYGNSPPFPQKSLQIISGLPEGAPVVAAVDGPRGGVAAPGPDRGSALAAAVDSAGHLHVALRDDSADGLRYARLGGNGTLNDYLIAQGPGLGTRVALTLSATGLPIIAAFSPAAPTASPPRAARLTAYLAKTSPPLTSNDWTASEIDTETVTLPPAPCGGPCPSGQVCIWQSPGAAKCSPLNTACAPCLPGQVCSAGQCRTAALAPPPLDAELLGRGASLDLRVLQNGQLVAAAYSSHSRDLAIYRRVGALWQKAIAAPPQGSQDAGRFVKLAEGLQGQLWAVAEDSQRGRLVLWREEAGVWKSEIVDSGDRSDGHHRVGADVAVARHALGNLLIAHQDTRRSDLLLRKGVLPGKPGALQTAAMAGAAGFAPSLVQIGSKAWVVAAITAVLEPSGALSHRVELRELIWAGE